MCAMSEPEDSNLLLAGARIEKSTMYATANGVVDTHAQQVDMSVYNGKMRIFAMKEITYIEIQQMITKNDEDRKHSVQIMNERQSGKDPYENGNFRLNFYRQVFQDDLVNGFMMTYPHGQIIKQAKRRYYYRGENQIYPTCKPSLLRNIQNQKNEFDKQIELFVYDMKIYEFKMLLSKFKHISNWDKQYSDVLYEPLAQHYGIETKWLDITNDFEVALFFACCWFNKEKRQWQPLTKTQTDLDNEKRFGVIFRQPDWRADLLSETSQEIQKITGKILPIGFQPFMRCHMQYGYAIKMDESMDLYTDVNFEKLKFKHSEKLSNLVFDKMQAGKLIFPNEGLLSCMDQIENIKDSKCFSSDAFEYAASKSKSIIDKDIYLNKLLSLNYTIGTTSVNISRQRIRFIDRKYQNFSLEKCYGISISTRLIHKPLQAID